MPRSLSTNALLALTAQETEEVFVILLTIEHDDLTDPIRVCSDNQNVVSRGETYIAFPFQLTLPIDDASRPPAAQLSIDNVTREIGVAIRTITSPARILFEIVRADAPDVVEVEFPNFLLRNVSYDALQVTGDLVVEDLTIEPYPGIKFTPANFPGLF